METQRELDKIKYIILFITQIPLENDQIIMGSLQHCLDTKTHTLLNNKILLSSEETFSLSRPHLEKDAITKY